MFEKNFDPLGDLQANQVQIQRLTNQLNECIIVINKLSQTVVDLHQRLQLLEMARQYEENNKP